MVSRAVRTSKIGNRRVLGSLTQTNDLSVEPNVDLGLMVAG